MAGHQVESEARHNIDLGSQVAAGHDIESGVNAAVNKMA